MSALAPSLNTLHCKGKKLNAQHAGCVVVLRGKCCICSVPGIELQGQPFPVAFNSRQFWF